MGRHMTEQHHIDFIQHKHDATAEALRHMLDTAMIQAYGEHHGVHWHVCHDEAACEGKLVFDARASSAASVMLSSSLALLGGLGWDKAARLLQASWLDMTRQGQLPCDVVLRGTGNLLAAEACYTAVVANMLGRDDAQERQHEVSEDDAGKTSELAHAALEKARAQKERFKTFVEHDLSRVAQDVKVEALEKLNISRLSAGALGYASVFLHRVGKALSSVADKADDALTCKSGEITSAGKLICKSCGYEMHFKKKGRIPPCPKCHKTEFKKRF